MYVMLVDVCMSIGGLVCGLVVFSWCGTGAPRSRRVWQTYVASKHYSGRFPGIFTLCWCGIQEELCYRRPVAGAANIGAAAGEAVPRIVDLELDTYHFRTWVVIAFILG